MWEDPQEELTPAPIGEDATPVDAVVVEAPGDPFEESVLAELEKIRNPKRGTWVRTLVILAVSLALFVGLDMQENPIGFTAMLVGVLLLHEMGHYVGMRIFGYRNVRMFFIPFFGAAVSGQRTDAKSYQEAIVTLLGPLPGLGVAIVLLVVAIVPGIGQEMRQNVLEASFLLALINGFNLLPVFPLDGGRLLNQILFSGNRYLESVFQFLAALAFIAYGVTQGRFLFVFLGGSFLAGIGPRFKANTIAQNIGGRLGDALPPASEPIPLLIVRGIVAQVRTSLPALKTPKAVAAVVSNVWEKMHLRPPGAVATAALLLVYLSGVAVALVLCLPVIRPNVLPFAGNSVERQMEALANEANKHLPMQVDEVTRLERVEPGPGKAFSYVYTLSIGLTEQQKRAMIENTTRRALAAPEMKATFAAGVTVWYRYYDPSGRKVLEFSVKQK